MASFILGWFAKAIFMSVIMEMVTRPVAKRITRWLYHQRVVIHYLEDHIGRSFDCTQCKTRS
jgi:hypothetical protein